MNFDGRRRLFSDSTDKDELMQILARLCMTADGYVTTPDGWPPQVIDPVHGPGSHGIAEFLRTCEAALMGRTTFEPALTADRWPWPDLKVFVLSSHRPEGTPDDVTVDDDPVRLLRRSARPIVVATSISSAGPAQSRPIAPSVFSTNSSSWFCRSSSAAACG
jgi:hypothetical protein